MSTSATDSSENGTPSSESQREQEPLLPPRIARAMAWLHPLHNAMIIDKIRGQNHIVQEHVKSMIRETGADVSDEMGDMSVGNEIHNHYTQKTGGGIGKTLAVMALGTVLGAGGVGAGLMASHFLSDKPEQVQDTDTDTSVSLGLGKIEDYLKQEGGKP